MLSMLVGFTYVYILCGISWYIIVFGVVYLGGVFILLIFLSMSSPNSSYKCTFSTLWFVVFWLFMSYYGNGVVLSYNPNASCGESLSTYTVGGVYVFYSVWLMIGFSLVSITASWNSGFFR